MGSGDGVGESGLWEVEGGVFGVAVECVYVCVWMIVWKVEDVVVGVCCSVLLLEEKGGEIGAKQTKNMGCPWQWK